MIAATSVIRNPRCPEPRSDTAGRLPTWLLPEGIAAQFTPLLRQRVGEHRLDLLERPAQLRPLAFRVLHGSHDALQAVHS